MEMRKTFFTIVALMCLLSFSGSALAARPPGAGSGGGSSGAGGGSSSPDYGDLFVLYRDGNGVPYVTNEVQVQEPETGEWVDGGLCQQPLPNTSCPENCKVPGFIYEEETDVKVVAVAPATCGVPVECAICTEEVEFERDNVIRAQDSVLEQQLEDATIKLATAGCITLDPAGRPVASNVVGDEVVSSAIDSPLQNLAFYKKLMQDGYVGSADNPIGLRAEDFLVSAARALGASAPKEGKIGVDTVVYMNEILGLTENGASQLPRISQDVREEVKGVMTRVTKWFLDYGNGDEEDYGYDRADNFSTTVDSLPLPAYIPDNTHYGWFEYTEKIGDYYVATQGPILEAVPEFIDTTYTNSLLAGFAQAADDTRAVINFMHTWPVLGDGAMPIVCGGTTPDFYDVSISERSGLQVPVRMAAAGDGREGSVTVYNDGPATAYDIRIMVSGVYKGADAEDHYVELLTKMGGVPIFEDDEDYQIVSIDPGYSEIITFFFMMDEATEIEWTAKADSDADVNPDNNVVTEFTTVNKPKGSGGGRH